MQGNFPFIFVQLPNFMEANPIPAQSNWATLRQAQLKTLAIPHTGMVVAIDAGEWNDIHPENKKDISLSLQARKLAYGENKLVYSGPLYTSMKKEGNKITISFTNTGSGLVIKNGSSLRYFAIAGSDQKWVWAKAEIRGKKVIVWNQAVPDPVAVRYAWADNPEGANLYNKEGLPASPFGTND
jgi:sialate O-acetylesterase